MEDGLQHQLVPQKLPVGGGFGFVRRLYCFQLLCRGVVRRQCADDLPNRLAVGGDFDGNRYQTRILLKPGFKLLMGPGMTLPLLRFSPQ